MTKTMSFSLDEKIEADIKKLAEERNISKSDVIREYHRIYQLQTMWIDIRESGAKIAKELGIETEEDVERIFG